MNARKSRQEGVTAIEYAILVALIALAILGSLGAAGLSNGEIWTSWATALLQAIGGG